MLLTLPKIPTFDELLKKVKMPKVPVVSDKVTPSYDPLGALGLGYKIPDGWKLKKDEAGDSLISPRGHTFSNIKFDPAGKIVDFQAFNKDLKPINFPKPGEQPFPKPPKPPEPPMVSGKMTAPFQQPPPVGELKPIGIKPNEWILFPDEIPLDKNLDPNIQQYHSLGLTASQYNQVIDSWRQYHPQDWNTYLEQGKRFAGFGWIDNPEEFARLETADVVGQRVIGLTTEKAHQLTDKLFPGLRSRIKTPMDQAQGQTSGLEAVNTDEQQLRQGGVSEDEIIKIATLSKKDLTADEWLNEYKKANPSLKKNLATNLSGRATISALGGMISSAGGIAGWAKQEKLSDNLIQMGNQLQTADPEQSEWKGINTLVDPRFWQVNAVSAVTSSMSFIPLGLASIYAPIPGGIGLFGSIVLRLLWGAVGAIPEASIEAGGAWNEAKASGMSPEVADKAATSTFWKNEGLLSVTNTLELASMLGINPFKETISKMALNGLVTVGRTGVATLTNAGEEYFQDIFTRQALGQHVVWDDQAKMATLLGGVIGLGMGGGGSVLTTIQNRIQSNLTPDLEALYDRVNAEGLRQGLSSVQAGLKALDAVAATPKGKKLIGDMVTVVQKEEQIKVIKDPKAKETLQKQIDELMQSQTGREALGEVAGQTLQTGAMAMGGKQAPITGEQIAQSLGVEFQGMTEGFPDMPPQLELFDPQTKGNFNASTLEEARTKLAAMRDAFAKADVEKLRAGFASEDAKLYDMAIKESQDMTRTKEQRDLSLATANSIKAKNPSVVTTSTAPAKEAWQMTREEYLNKIKKESPGQTIFGGLDTVSIRRHREHIQQALSEGKPVPQSVLADYPDLAKQAPEVKAPAGEVTKLTQSEIQSITDIIDSGVFKENVSQTIQRDGQRLLDAVNKGDTKTIEAIQQKYERQAGMGVSGGAGPGKVKQPPLGSVVVWNAATKALKREVTPPVTEAKPEVTMPPSTSVQPGFGIGEKPPQAPQAQPVEAKAPVEAPVEPVIPAAGGGVVSPPPPPADLALSGDFDSESGMVRVGDTFYTPEQVDVLVDFLGEYLNSPNAKTATELTRQLQSKTRAQRASALYDRTEELIATGIAPESAMKQALGETMSGKLPIATDEYITSFTGDLRDALFAKVYLYFKDKPNEVLERTSTITALTNLLAKGYVPDVPGTAGGSAFTRLQRVFGSEPKTLAIIENLQKEKKPLKNVVEGIFHEVGREPVPIDEATADYLRALPDYSSQGTLGAVIPGEGAVKFVYDPSGKLGLELQGQQTALGDTSKEAYKTHLSTAPMAEDTRLLFEMDMVNNEIPEDVRDTVLSVYDKQGLDDAFDRLGIEMAQGPRPPKRPDNMEQNIWDEFEKPGMPNFTFGEKSMIVNVLQQIGMSPIDIGNFLRANMSSVDLSFFRTGRMLGSGHPVAFYKSMVAGWKATWSEAEAKTHWKTITQDPDFELYEKIRLDNNYDPLRVPARERDIAAYRKSEEYGYPIEERFIPRMGKKLPHIKMSSRGFETALNDLVWSVWKQQLAVARRYGLKVASGEIKMKPGEAWNIEKEMTDHQRMLGDMVQRASLNINVGKLHADFTPASPVLGGALFAPRAKWARLIVGRHLFSANPRVRAEAWKDMSIWIASTAGIILLGELLGLWEVEKDPVSGEFMSVRIGKVRIDPWEGHRQIVNLYSRLITGQTKSTITGKKTPTDVMDTLGNFIRSSLNVLPGLLVDLRSGKTYTGEKTDITNLKQTAQRVLPFSLSQIWQTFQGDWRIGLATLPISVLGENISTYETPESVVPKFIENLGKLDQTGLDTALKTAEKNKVSSSKIAEIKAEPRVYDIESLRRDLANSTSKGTAKNIPIVDAYWQYADQEKAYNSLGDKEKAQYLKDNPSYVTNKIFWEGNTTIPDLKTAQSVVAQAKKYNIPLNMIPAFQFTDKGKERIPSDQTLWKPYFDYNDLPGSSYLAFTQEQVDAGELPEKYVAQWEAYHKLKTDTAKDYFRKASKNKEVSRGDWRDNFRRANPDFDAWLQEQKDMKPLAKTVARYGVSSRITLPSAGGGSLGGSVAPRRTARTYPKFKQPSISTAMRVSAPRAPGV